MVAPSRAIDRCAQRLAASQEKSLYRRWRCNGSLLVLNASRHHRKNRDSRAVRDRTFAASAQRLAASQEKSRRLGSCVRRSRQCSTPRGITGKIAQLDERRVVARVLNASRHHRKNRQINALPSFITRIGAQRLAASQEKSLVARARCDARLRSAQRLAASQEQSRRAEHRSQRNSRVLNASRHHRNNRAMQIATLGRSN